MSSCPFLQRGQSTRSAIEYNLSVVCSRTPEKIVSVALQLKISHINVSPCFQKLLHLHILTLPAKLGSRLVTGAIQLHPLMERVQENIILFKICHTCIHKTLQTFHGLYRMLRHLLHRVNQVKFVNMFWFFQEQRGQDERGIWGWQRAEIRVGKWIWDVHPRSKESSAHLSRKARGKSKSFEVWITAVIFWQFEPLGPFRLI